MKGLQEVLSNSPLVILCEGSEEAKKRAWEDLMRMQHNEWILGLVASFASNDLRQKAWDVLMEKQYIEAILADIVCYSTDENWQQKAWNKLNCMDNIVDNLAEIVIRGSEKWSRPAFEKLASRKDSNYALSLIVIHGSGEFRQKALKELLKRNNIEKELKKIDQALSQDEWYKEAKKNFSRRKKVNA